MIIDSACQIQIVKKFRRNLKKGKPRYDHGGSEQVKISDNCKGIQREQEQTHLHLIIECAYPIQVLEKILEVEQKKIQREEKENLNGCRRMVLTK